MQENWYILYALVDRQEQLCSVLSQQGLRAFVPKMEYYRRDRKELAVKAMFPGYVFIRSELGQEAFDRLLTELGERKQGMIRQLKEEGTTAMRKEEREFFSHLLDDTGLSKMSYGYLKGGRAVVTEGPLLHFQERIVKTDKHNRLAWLDFEFMHRRIQAGLTIQKAQQAPPENTEPGKMFLDDGTTVDIEKLKSKMMGL